MQRIAEVQRSHAFEAEYLLVMEFLFPVNDQTIFGIQCYVLDKAGENAFSFLLNSHHQLFVDADLIAKGTSEAARAKLMAKATQAGVTALKQQIERARKVQSDAMQSRYMEKEQPCTGTQNVEYPINELPMFGNQKKTAHQLRADEEYIKYMTRDGRSREAGAESAAKLGWNSYYAGDCSKAIKRFNQAWLLDPDNRLALWGFASICISRGQLDEAIRYLELAIEKGPEDPKLREDYDMTMKELFATSHNQQPLQ
ncbi:MAG: tetratricopeptide repeat protein [Gammaproteobacteria bacterium]|nr:tetratricopeptide repeat protein [Gammaproteobacteria bacterium]MBT8109596.1 tetratricopeptide repeat protein [Gammaproteobacteria bacterium]NND47245.1 tetratricopeptide repeat protein [Woeseiaceae bacterium]NNL44298.1 tetratricopeptide repeat protein [Woeseiaceae bacterium]